ncbi:hypothetical protein PsorP6_017178 [Peronosclerospora sorghi]|uniref:Uncharacterized protein n=1 Tax=Peronosclerospora sorghi TaxID=230839 RepID=A0ACC0WEF9_9STRA|nr:hypothetical protein PsorP6_017178 [Peronosclerospora sorghi]
MPPPPKNGRVTTQSMSPSDENPLATCYRYGSSKRILSAPEQANPWSAVPTSHKSAIKSDSAHDGKVDV